MPSCADEGITRRIVDEGPDGGRETLVKYVEICRDAVIEYYARPGDDSLEVGVLHTPNGTASFILARTPEEAARRHAYFRYSPEGQALQRDYERMKERYRISGNQ